jgi:RHS repeat-associated protein
MTEFEGSAAQIVRSSAAARWGDRLRPRDDLGGRAASATFERPYGFTGREHDAETGPIYFRARASAQRSACSYDLIHLPVLGHLNVYVYVWNDLHNWTDQSGMFASPECRGLARQTAALTFAVTGICTGSVDLQLSFHPTTTGAR